MTCGICNPKAFRPSPKASVYGYTTFKADRAQSVGGAVPNLYFMGCQSVFMDQARGNVCHRQGLKLLMKAMRPGDRLVIDHVTSLGTKPDRQVANIAQMVAMGIEVMVLTDQCEVLLHAAWPDRQRLP